MHCYEDQDAIDICSNYPNTIGKALSRANELIDLGRHTIVASELLPARGGGYLAFVLAVRESGVLLFCEEQPDMPIPEIKAYLRDFERGVMDAFELSTGTTFDSGNPISEHDELGNVGLN